MTQDRYQQIETAYSSAAKNYADYFFNELDEKPLDRKLLQMFADRVNSEGEVCEVGCGPGQISVFLNDLGVNIYGTDLSEGMIVEARRLSPTLRFEQESMFNLSAEDDSLAGIVGFYAIVNLPIDDLKPAFDEFARTLQPSAPLLISFHVGNQTRLVDEFMDKKVSLEFIFHQPEDVEAVLESAGLSVDEIVTRSPYAHFEHPSQRCYIFAHK